MDGRLGVKRRAVCSPTVQLGDPVDGFQERWSSWM
jgi:hypothetical protein